MNHGKPGKLLEIAGMPWPPSVRRAIHTIHDVSARAGWGRTLIQRHGLSTCRNLGSVAARSRRALYAKLTNAVAAPGASPC